MEAESMSRYVSPVHPQVFPHLSLLLLASGVFLIAWFSVLEVSGVGRSVGKEATLALAGAVFTGCGLLFLLLHVGIYV